MSRNPADNQRMEDFLRYRDEVLNSIRRSRPVIDSNGHFEDIRAYFQRVSAQANASHNAHLERLRQRVQESGNAIIEMIATEPGGPDDGLHTYNPNSHSLSEPNNSNNRSVPKPTSQQRFELLCKKSKTLTKDGLDSIIPSVPDDYLCPISYEMINDPIRIPTEERVHAYERSCLKEWFLISQQSAYPFRSPMTRLPVVGLTIAVVDGIKTDTELKVKISNFLDNFEKAVNTLEKNVGREADARDLAPRTELSPRSSEKTSKITKQIGE